MSVLPVVVLWTAFLVTAGCADVSPAAAPPLKLPDGQVVSLAESVEVKEAVIAGLDITESTLIERDELLRQLASAVVPEAAEREAFLRVVALNERASTRVETLGEASFTFTTDNELVIKDLTQARAGTLLDTVRTALDSLTPAERSDPYGFLRVAADIAAEATGETLVVLLGDAISTVPHCQVQVLFGPQGPVRPLTELARECMGSAGFPDLRGSDVWALGAGVDIDAPLPDHVAAGAQALLREIVRNSNGGAVRWTAAALPRAAAPEPSGSAGGVA